MVVSIEFADDVEKALDILARINTFLSTVRTLHGLTVNCQVVMRPTLRTPELEAAVSAVESGEQQ